MAELRLKNDNIKINLDSENIFSNLPKVFYDILDNVSFINNGINFTKTNFIIYPFNNKDVNNLEIIYIKDFQNKIFSDIENSLFSQIGDKFKIINSYSYILHKESTFLNTTFSDNLNLEKYQGIKVIYTPKFFNNLTLRSFYGINNNNNLSNLFNQEPIFSYGVTFSQKFKNYGNMIFDYFKYPELDNFLFSYSSNNIFVIYDNYKSNNDTHYTIYAEALIYKSNLMNCVFKDQELSILGGIAYDKDNSKILPTLSIYSTKKYNFGLNLLLDKNNKLKYYINSSVKLLNNINTSSNKSITNKFMDELNSKNSLSNGYKSFNIFNCNN